MGAEVDIVAYNNKSYDYYYIFLFVCIHAFT
jgi:hypothetical protein